MPESSLSELSCWLSEMKLKILLFWLTVLFLYFLTSPGETHFTYFSLLAKAFSTGNFYIEIPHSPHLSELISISENKYFVPYAPFPALLLTPFTFLKNEMVSQTFFSIVLGSLIGVVTFLNSNRITHSKKTAFFIAIFASLGTNIWYHASVGSSWYFAQIVACLFLSLAIYSVIPDHDPGSRSRVKHGMTVWTGLFLGAAYLSRPHLILSLPFFIFATSHPGPRSGIFKTIRFRVEHGMTLLIGILPFLLFNFYYNFVRFGVIWDKGYALIPNVLEEPWYTEGIFHYSYIPRHLEALFLKLPIFYDQFPFIKPDIIGMAFWVISPIFLVLFFYEYKDRLSRLSLLASFLIFIPISMHGAIGFVQLGYRFAIDFYPFLFIILALIYKQRGLKKFDYALLFISILMNFWGIKMG